MTLLLMLACSSGPATPEPETPPAEAPAPTTQKPAGHDAAIASEDRLDLNAATSDELAKLPGMTPKMVHEFEEYRPYKSIRQFRKEMGKYVDAEQIAAWEPYVYVPIDANACDAETLQQIPGIDAERAARLIASRPFKSTKAFLGAVEDVSRTEHARAAEHLLAR